MPKRPSTAYFHFLADFRKKMKGTDVGHKDVISQAGQAWQRLSEDEKEPYQLRQREEKIAYEDKMAEYRANLRSAPDVDSDVMDDEEEDEKEEEKEEEEEE